MGGFANYLLPVQMGSPDMAIQDYSSYSKSIGSYSDEELGFYLSGLIEGDGYLSINHRNILIIAITFHILDTPLASKIIAYLGEGVIAKRKTQSIELRFSRKEAVLQLLTLLNGKFRTPKIDQLYKAIDFANKKYSSKFIKKPLDTSSLVDHS
jgi:hypothetical protein